MKIFRLVLVILFLFFVGCSKDISKYSKDECLKNGYKYKKVKTMNYLTGKYVVREICTQK
ncbi:hypothetical protein CPU12_06795 [Malaciobacter molluscorum LMG 25693]|uniref:Lipoprotein n=1 Tax=Malaciobacter molluscorum LMG 25693 TaxID=870501 RepID=A0A2G1DIJ4_9BACT|nr:hypothetical protein [Malaciobacter molluscorum]AXX92385.1 hypothetical protein AMOL_1410 [Malaciobacter molluscorum LMG 25693]PHO18166.1 hypothetical protein CPU12_06795 [Malaciobacter molluscorum LMG 25693]RXJ93955.1 hypothetical protein CRV00_08740 [Malaciobacter molluscorum]